MIYLNCLKSCLHYCFVFFSSKCIFTKLNSSQAQIGQGSKKIESKQYFKDIYVLKILHLPGLEHEDWSENKYQAHSSWLENLYTQQRKKNRLGVLWTY